MKHNAGRPDFFVSLAGIDSELLSGTDLVTNLEKYGVGNVAYIPSNDVMINLRLLGSTSVPDYIKAGNDIIKTIDVKIFIIEQKTFYNEIHKVFQQQRGNC